ncbi:hypothetical protein WS79_15925 [Burkholderia territorii]|nr:hypothetical protein WS79_15925 [Burkholderia territorii]
MAVAFRTIFHHERRDIGAHHGRRAQSEQTLGRAVEQYEMILIIHREDSIGCGVHGSIRQMFRID